MLKVTLPVGSIIYIDCKAKIKPKWKYSGGDFPANVGVFIFLVNT